MSNENQLIPHFSPRRSPCIPTTPRGSVSTIYFYLQSVTC